MLDGATTIFDENGKNAIWRNYLKSDFREYFGVRLDAPEYFDFQILHAKDSSTQMNELILVSLPYRG